jgi:hypothetical protein
VNCWVAPIAKLAGLGVTAKAVTGFVTVAAAVPIMPLNEAVTVVEPGATPVTSPPEPMVATDALELVQVAVDVTLAIEPSV